MDNNIRINKIGKILKGDDVGSFIKFIDDFENTGGYLIFISEDNTFENTFDDWVEDLTSLRSYIIESQWEIDWNSKK